MHVGAARLNVLEMMPSLRSDFGLSSNSAFADDSFILKSRNAVLKCLCKLSKKRESMKVRVVDLQGQARDPFAVRSAKSLFCSLKNVKTTKQSLKAFRARDEEEKLGWCLNDQIK